MPPHYWLLRRLLTNSPLEFLVLVWEESGGREEEIGALFLVQPYLV